MRDFVRDPSDWLRKLTPDEWIRAALAEHAKQALSLGGARAALAGCKRAAGMALNGALIVAPNPAWRRTYLEHPAAADARTYAQGERATRRRGRRARALGFHPTRAPQHRGALIRPRVALRPHRNA